MNDFRDLKAIAEVCQQHQPLRFMRSHGALYIRNDNGIVFDVHQNRSFPEFMAQNKDYADLVVAANPATVLALIAENESARKHWQNESNNVQVLVAEVARLNAENEALRREREGKVLCDLELFETLRDSANTEADEHRQCMATYRPLRQASLDSVVKKCDYLLAAMRKGEQS